VRQDRPTTTTTSPPEHRWKPSRVRSLVAVAIVVATVGAALARAANDEAAPVSASIGVWLDASEVADLPMTGASWDNVVTWADGRWGAADIADQNSDHDMHVLAGALYATRTGDASMRARVVDALRDAIGSERGATALAVGRNVVGYVAAADLVGYRQPAFVRWLRAVRDERFAGRSLVSTHEERPNNWGTHAGAARIAIDRFIGDDADLRRAARVFRGWLGDRSAYAGFVFGARRWQADREAPVGVNASGARIEGHPVDGVLPEEMRRAGRFRWPPPREPYAWGGLGGALLQAELLERAGFRAFEWSDRALLRAAVWLHEQADFPAEGDDTWQPWLLNATYDTSFPAEPSAVGKPMGFTDWTHAG
jgi:hypothetical protein